MFSRKVLTGCIQCFGIIEESVSQLYEWKQHVPRYKAVRTVYIYSRTKPVVFKVCLQSLRRSHVCPGLEAVRRFPKANLEQRKNNVIGSPCFSGIHVQTVAVTWSA